MAHCSHFRIKNCKGVCRGQESIDEYNARVLSAIKVVSADRENFLIKERGREPGEDAIVCIREGCYLGYGFVSRDETIHSQEDLMAHIIPQQHTIESQQLISSYLTRHPDKAMPLQTAKS